MASIMHKVRGILGNLFLCFQSHAYVAGISVLSLKPGDVLVVLVRILGIPDVERERIKDRFEKVLPGVHVLVVNADAVDFQAVRLDKDGE